MEDQIKITYINDFIFCPLSIYCHSLYDGIDDFVVHEEYQINGKSAHKSVDKGTYINKDAITGLDVYCSKYNLIGKIDIYYPKEKLLVERKNKVSRIYDGYIYQLYAQYYSLLEMGYEINKLQIRSVQDNKVYTIPLPDEDLIMKNKFESTLMQIESFRIDIYKHYYNKEKCEKCIYKHYCYEVEEC